MNPGRQISRWVWIALACTLAKLWLTASQTVYAIGYAFHDDRLFAILAGHILNGEWLGSYDQFTLAKGPMYSLFIAGMFWLGLPLLLAQQVFYAGACAAVTAALGPWVRSGAVRLGIYSLLLWNPMSYDAGNLTRLMRQSIYTPLAMLTVAGLLWLYHRRETGGKRTIAPAVGAGLALGGFWLTREESVWLLPAVALLWLGLALGATTGLWPRVRQLLLPAGLFLGAFLVPVGIISSLNQSHYGWFGTVEFRATEFKDAYGALSRIAVGPTMHQVPVTRQMRETVYTVSPTFARLRPWLEGPVGDHWSEKDLFAATDRQIRGGWFMWALRDAAHEAGVANDAGGTLAFFRRIADEVNAACDTGRVPARAPRSGFLPPLDYTSVNPIITETVTYTGFFLRFDGFTPYSPDSLGDYAELKAFRDVAGTRLSPAPRSPEPVGAEIKSLDKQKLGALGTIGDWFASAVRWLGPLLLLIGGVRWGEAILERRVSFLLLAATGLLGACAAYLTINILVQVTSFYNMSPAAMAAAYPLYLIGLVVIGLDAWHAWRAAPAARARPPARDLAAIYRWLPVTGAAVLVFAARIGFAGAFGSPVAFNDQWYIEARDLLVPWLEGRLSILAFLQPHFEHVPVWTRLLGWLEVVISGRWDPTVQMTVNAGIHAGFTAMLAGMIWRHFSRAAATSLTLLLIAGSVLPHAWENIAWGFQSQFPVALLLLFVQVHGTLTQPAGSRRWWWAQAAGLASLFTLASMWLAPLAVIVTSLWIDRRSWRQFWAPGLLVVLGAGLLISVRLAGTSDNSFLQVASSPWNFLQSALHLLGWPSALPGAMAIVQLPWLIHWLRVRNQPATPAIDRVILSLGLWSLLQALALAAARTGDTAGFVSRYGDLLFVGTLAGAMSFVRLIPAPGGFRRLHSAVGVAWIALIGTGLVQVSGQGHANYFYLHAKENDSLRRQAIRNYVQRGDDTLLSSATARYVLGQDPRLVAQMLDRPDFRRLLPHNVLPENPPAPIGHAARWLQQRWMILALAGGLLSLAGIGLAWWRPAFTAHPTLPAAAGDPWRTRLAAVAAAGAFGLVLAWSNPFRFDVESRWRDAIGGDAALPGVTFAFAGPSEFGPERLQGAAPLTPPILRNLFHGTAPAGPTFTGVVVSAPFTLQSPWLVVPYAGYPTGHGNGLRLRLLDAHSADTSEEIGCPGPGGDRIRFWTVDTSRLQGRQARLVLYDGRTDTEAWVAVAPPVPTTDPQLAGVLTQQLIREQQGATRVTLWVITLVAVGGLLASWRYNRFRPAL
ncbi:MAG: hypothetical protein RIS54_1806 [Verrucomicrobiota bacterium]